MRLAGRWLSWLLACFWTVAAAAAEPSPEFVARANDLVPVLNGEPATERLFSAAFLAQVPSERLAGIAALLRSSYGRAEAVQRIEAGGPTSGILFVRFERAVVRLQVATGAQAPHRIEGLVVAGVESSAADLAAVVAGLAALPGEVSLATVPLEGPGGAGLPGRDAEKPLAIGSAFKLFILAELVRSIKAGERRWSDVVPLGAPSLPSGLLQDWPAGSPITLHSLAALMISRSDNSAADTLLALLGREKVERLLPRLGVRSAERNRPFLATREAFALKLGDPTILARWKAADESRRRLLLAELKQVGATGHRLWEPAAEQLTRLIQDAGRAGVDIGITDSYRSYEAQVDVARRKGLYSQGGLAAVPGTSDHGWGMAVDLDLDAQAQAWMRKHGPAYGFHEDTPREPWHWGFKPPR